MEMEEKIFLRVWVGFGYVFIFIYLVERVEYPLDKKHKTRGPPETQIRKIIKSSIRPSTTHERPAGRTNGSGGSVFTGFCPPLIVAGKNTQH